MYNIENKVNFTEKLDRKKNPKITFPENAGNGRKMILLKTLLNTSYLTDSFIIFTLKMESAPKNTIFGLK